MRNRQKRKKWFFTIRGKLSIFLIVISVMTLVFSAGISYHLASERVMNISKRLSVQSMGSQGGEWTSKPQNHGNDPDGSHHTACRLRPGG